MPLRHHPKLAWQGRPSWPPQWTGAVARGAKAPLGEQGVLKAVVYAPASPTTPAHLTLVIAYEGNVFSGQLFAEDPGVVDALYPTLRACLDWPVQQVGSLEVDL